MNNPQYGYAHQLLSDAASAITLTPYDGTGASATAYTSAVYASPLITDITVTTGGTIKEFVDYNGQIAGFEVSGEYVDITFTVLPQASSKANALIQTNMFRKGTPFVVANAPVLKLLGHAAEASVTADFINTTVFLQSDDRRFSLEGQTTGTMTFRRYFTATITKQNLG